jgi:hypothetical protein
LACAGLQGLHAPRIPSLHEAGSGVLSWTWASFRVLQASSGRYARPRKDGTEATPPMRFSSPTASPRSEQRHRVAGFASPDRLRLQVFSTSWRVDPPRACRPCFVPDPLMGFCPSERCSPRVAVRRLRRLYPPGVGKHDGRSTTRNRPNCNGKPPQTEPETSIRKTSRAPLTFRVLLHTRIRHSRPAV